MRDGWIEKAVIQLVSDLVPAYRNDGDIKIARKFAAKLIRQRDAKWKRAVKKIRAGRYGGYYDALDALLAIMKGAKS